VKLEDALLRCNRNEFHHIFPKNHLKESGVAERVNALANFCFISAADNQIIKDKAPSDYIKLINAKSRPDVLARALIPEKFATMSYEQFLSARSKLLVQQASELCK